MASLFLLLLLATATLPASATTLVQELAALRSRSSAGVIRLDDKLVHRLLLPTPRPYTLLVFFDAVLAHGSPELRSLAVLRSEFALVSAAFSRSNPGSATLFFCDVEHGQSPDVFSRFNVTSLPHVALVGSEGEPEAVPRAVVEGMAEGMAEFVETSIGVSVGPIKRPPSPSVWWVLLPLLFLAAIAPFAIRKVLRGETVLTDQRFWMVCALVIYFFGVSGSMFGVIQKMPMVLRDPEKPHRLMLFYQGPNAQLGTEGAVIGLLYMAVGVILALVTHSLARVDDVAAQRIYMVAAMIATAWAVAKVVSLDNWKTGYAVGIYWPHRWRRS